MRNDMYACITFYLYFCGQFEFSIYEEKKNYFYNFFTIFTIFTIIFTISELFEPGKLTYTNSYITNSFTEYSLLLQSIVICYFLKLFCHPFLFDTFNILNLTVLYQRSTFSNANYFCCSCYLISVIMVILFFMYKRKYLFEKQFSYKRRK